ncbi:hypothetical protein J14TS2_49140 [Bacillus sp. J14TS2]|uniref:hypothetical protein n=1 Tax=Bacillus sp. J14TS2 TaxID=2807188 RepID=UPI001B05582C|nr:hypothetical protein [Bacillus sp. J14TS2]GIN74439.1 hypothetical protein J14TS2_49140 [Bacillus sp. J14TS2]
MLLKNYVAALIQIMIWSGFHVAQWLSGKDRFLAKVLLFLVFFYLAYLVARKIIGSKGATILTTIMSLCTYISLQFLLQFLFY